jgi:leucyl-tRNA synthetase
MNQLYKLEHIKFGERYSIYSPKDGQPCMDHDRQSGEGVAPQEYTCIKLKLVQWNTTFQALLDSPDCAQIAGKDIYFIPATLRPETMYGQTNCFVSPTITYGFFAASDTDVYVMTERAARNMAFQGITAAKEKGKLVKLYETVGANLVGAKVNAPLSVYKEVYVLPMDTVLATKVRFAFHSKLKLNFNCREQELLPRSPQTRLLTTRLLWT